MVISHGEVLLHSLSGAGKTSLVNAGLIPALEKAGFEVLPPARVQGLLPRDHNPQEIENIYIFNALLSLAEEGTGVEELAHLPLTDYLKKRSRYLNKAEKPLPRVIIFDQFEELFTFYPERWEDRGNFLQQVSAMLHEDASLRVVFVMRNEYVAQLLTFSSLFPERLRTRFSLERLRYEGALAAVKEPAEKGGRSFAPDVAEQLVEDLLQGPVVTSTGATQMVRGEFVEPVQLQVVCDRLWQAMPPQVKVIGLEHLRTFGDVNQALIRYYEDAVTTAAQKARVRQGRLRKWFETRLITEQGTRAIVARGEEHTAGMLNQAVDILQELHLVRSENRAGAQWYELTHDRLIEPIRLVARQQRRRHLRGLTVTAAAVVLIGVSILTGLLIVQDRELRQMQRAFEAISDQKADPESRVRSALQWGLNASAQGREVTPELRGAMRDAIKALRLRPRFAVNVPDVKDMAFGPAELFLATVDENHRVRVSDGKTGRELWSLPPHAEAVQRVAFSQNGSRLTTVDRVGTVQVWEAPWNVPINEPLAIRTGAILAISPDGGWIATYNNQKVVVQNALAGEDRKLSIGGDKILRRVRSVAFSQHGGRVATGHDDGTIMVWNLGAKSGLSGQDDAIILRGHTAKVLDIAFGGNDALLVSAGDDQMAKIWDLEFGNELLTLSDHIGAVTRTVVSSDGMHLATYSTDKMVRVWNLSSSLASGPVRGFYGHYKGINRLTFATGGSLASIDGTGNLRLWDLGSGQETWSSQGKARFRDVSFSRDGTQMATLDENRVRIWDPKTGQVLHTLARQGAGLLAAAISSDGKYLATGSWDGTAAVWDAQAKQLLFTLSGHMGVVWDVSFNRDGTRLATASKDATAKVWEVATGKELLTLAGHTKDVRRVVFDTSGQHLATASWDMTAGVWDANSGKALLTLTGHTRPINSVAFNQDGSRLATAASDGTVKIWDIQGGRELLTYRSHRRSVRDTVFSPDSEHVVSAGADKTVRIWGAGTGQDVRQPLSGHTGTIWSVTMSPDGGRIATASEDNTVRLWDVNSGEELRAFRHDAGVNQVLFAGSSLVSVGEDKAVRWWDTASGEEVFTLEVHPMRSISMHPGGTQVAIVTAEEASIWDVTAARQRTLRHHGKDLLKVAYTSDGGRLAVLSKDGSITAWDAKTGDEIFTSAHDSKDFRTFSFNQDGSRLAAAGRNGPPIVFDVASGKMVAIMDLQLGEVQDIALSPEGRFVAAVGWDNSLYVWQVDTGRPLFKFPAKTHMLGRIAFSPDGWYLAYGGASGEDGAVRVYSFAEWRISVLEDLIAHGFSSLPGLMSQGVAKALKGDYQGAMRDLQALLEQSPNTRDAELYRECVRALGAGKNPFTIRRLLQVAAEEPSAQAAY